MHDKHIILLLYQFILHMLYTTYTLTSHLKFLGLLNVDGLQVYALALWKLGRHDEALSISQNLAENLSNMKQESATGALGFICTLAYNIAGKDSAASVIHTLPGQPSYNRELKFIISALDALQPSKRFQLPHLSMPPRLTSYDVMSEVHSNIALGKAVSTLIFFGTRWIFFLPFLVVC